MIRVEHLSKRYGNRYALDDVSFEIEKGEIVGLLGANGAGKSTTMNILTGYLSATEGEVYVDGVNVLDEPMAAKRKIGYLPEQPPLYFDMTVREYLDFVYELKGCEFPREAHLGEIMNVVKITDVRDRLIGHLSKGYRQRVGIASALVGDPPLLIFDEPTVGLDPKQIIEVRNLLRTLGKKHTVVLSTHILSEVQAVCERIVVIKEGRIVACERTEDITRRLETEARFCVKIAGASAGEIKEALRAIRDVSHVEQIGGRDGESYPFSVETKGGADIRRAVFQMCVSRGWVLYGLERRGLALEDVFVRLMDSNPDAPLQSEKKKR
ncbi:MAG: ATP-binding cassette domain-containing protein [Ruminococcaceae bacterium]|nr:ATP-binding cassette domain-containing protein [Oscillospiraceae bacterium]